ncbi:hypothetical protein HYC85_014073 [Camellia sinensis]|uniref:Ribonuclease n=1 Tax=Camellia sinensis TaxID=4442 RepID=A0A7J7H8J5_CAMSI|nr:hypothetical protein HYC85_014073 [Camellia sinensis]
MGSEVPLPKWASDPCIMGIDEAGRGPVLGPMLFPLTEIWYKTLPFRPLDGISDLLFYADSKTLKEEKREELFENLKVDESIGRTVDVIDPRELSAKMLQKIKINLNEISHNSTMGLVSRVLNMAVLLTEVVFAEFMLSDGRAAPRVKRLMGAELSA